MIELNFQNIIVCLVLFISSAIFTCAFVPLAKFVAEKTDAIDYPSGRRINKKPIARTGGVAMFCGMSCSLLIIYGLVKLDIIPTPFVAHPYLNIDWTIAGIGVLVMFCVGIIDDIYDLSPQTKLFGQIISACIIASSGILLVSIGNPFGASIISLGVWSYPLTVLYLVTFANVINLIDGLDGLASGITIISSITIIIFACSQGRMDVLIIGAALIGACLAFMKYNWYPAKMFMGDAGALVLGLMLGILSVVGIARSTLFTSLLVPILSAGIPILDTLLSIIRRKIAHVPIMSADKGHIHHRLLNTGYSHKKVVIIMLLWTVLLSVVSIVITVSIGWIRIAVSIFVVVIAIVAVFKLNVISPALAHKYTPRLSRRHIIDGTYSREDLDKAKSASNIGDKNNNINDVILTDDV